MATTRRVVNRHGIEAVVAYGGRIPKHGSTPRHREALESLLAGGSVTVEDSEISALAVSDGATIYIRFRGDRYRTRIRVRPMTTSERLTHCPGEVRDVPPTIDDWRVLLSNGVRWELYSCVVEAMYSDRV